MESFSLDMTLVKFRNCQVISCKRYAGTLVHWYAGTLVLVLVRLNVVSN